MRPPVVAAIIALFSERAPALYTGKVTETLFTSIAGFFFSAPVGDARAVARKEGDGDRATDQDHSNHGDPHLGRRHSAEQRHADDFEQVVERIPVQEYFAALERGRRPEDRREEKRDLHDAGDDRRDIAEPRTQRADDDADPERNG